MGLLGKTQEVYWVFLVLVGLGYLMGGNGADRIAGNEIRGR